MYHDEKVTLKNHVLAAAKRLLSHGDVEGSAVAAKSLLDVGVWLDGVTTTTRPPAKAKTGK